MPKLEILHRETREVLYAGEGVSLRDLVTYASAKGLKLAGADLRGANLGESVPNGVNLCGADLEGADLSRATLAGAFLTNARLKGARLDHAFLASANLYGADLEGASCPQATFCRAGLGGASLARGNFDGAFFHGARLCLADLTGSSLRGAYFHGASLAGASLNSTDLSGARFRGADLEGADLRGAVGFWQSHDVLAELLLRAAGDDLGKRKVAGLVLASRDWCWDTFLTAGAGGPDLDWALSVLAAAAHPTDRTTPDVVRRTPPAFQPATTP